MNRKAWAFVAIVLAALLLFAQTGFAETVCKLGDKGEQVRIVQIRLKTLGYSSKAPEAPYKFTKATAAAVKLFQAASALSVTGVVDHETYTRLTSSTAVTYENYIESEKDAQNRIGGSGAYVLETERRLKKLGYFSGTANKLYDEKTAAAVKLFQNAHNLTANGVADRETRSVLFGSDAMTYAQYSQSGNLVTVKLGSKGDQVKVVQTQLKALGYFTSTVNGVYDKTVKAAVTIFQEANALTQNGIADETTRALLNAGTGKDYETYASEQALTEVSFGDSGFAVQLLQERLAALYYYDGKISGQFTAAVRNSVKRFQNANGVNKEKTTYHGIATVATRRAMNADTAIDRVESEGLFAGDSMAEVAVMTARLKKLGYLNTAYTAYNATVTAAVKVFQKANGLTVSGTATRKTLDVMESDDAITYSEFKNGSGNARIERMIKIAYKYISYPYSSNANPPKSFDCSRYTRFVFAKMGISMSGEVQAQGKSMASKYGAITSLSDLKRGDLLYFDTQTDKNPGHAAIYLGVVNGKPRMIHASSSKGKVVETEVHEWYQKRFDWGVRVFK